jgi:peptide/nickel transport system permease protein
MVRYTLRRLLGGLGVLVTLTMVTFLLFGPILQANYPIDAATLVAGPRATPESVVEIRKTLKLDKPWYEQYWLFLRRIIAGPSSEERERFCDPGQDCSENIGRLGTSFVQNLAVDKVIRAALPVTVSLAAATVIIWLMIAIPIGILSALRSRSIFDRVTMVGVLWGQALPVYYFGLLALYFLAYLPNSRFFYDIFGIRFEIFPIGGYADFAWSNPWPWFHHLILPAATLALQFAAIYVRMIRSNMLTTMGEDYIRTARAKGVRERDVVVRHALRNALLPIVTMVGLDLGILLGGAILTESTFGLPGLGQVTITAAQQLDVPLTTGVVLFAAACIVLFNIVVDLLYAVLDPRIRLA